MIPVSMKIDTRLKATKQRNSFRLTNRPTVRLTNRPTVRLTNRPNVRLTKHHHPEVP
jgi:hypothetical protein